MFGCQLENKTQPQTCAETTKQTNPSGETVPGLTASGSDDSGEHHFSVEGALRLKAEQTPLR